MKKKLLMILTLFAGITTANCQEKECTGGWIKYPGSPVLGGDLGVIFDVCVICDNSGTFRMYCSCAKNGSIALSESKDGLKWTEPIVCLVNNNESGWENAVSRPTVVQKDGMYHMWYTGNVWSYDNATMKWSGISKIGYATSSDGRTFKRISDKPIVSPDIDWEKTSVGSSHVIWDEQAKLFKMWYFGGEYIQPIEPDAVGYATSPDGIHWQKYHNNPVFQCNKSIEWEQTKVTAFQVIKRDNNYLILYIGFKNTDYAQIGMARSKDGITNWERYPENPIIKPGLGWDAQAVYKPYAVPDPKNNRWLLYYNGRGKKTDEQIGVAIHNGMDLGF